VDYKTDVSWEALASVSNPTDQGSGMPRGLQSGGCEVQVALLCPTGKSDRSTQMEFDEL
jgi:hypothetical protein